MQHYVKAASGSSVRQPAHSSEHTITESRVHGHVFLLIGQAIFLAVLALIHIAFQFQVVRLEAEAQPVLNKIYAQRLKNAAMAQARANKPVERASQQTLGAQDENISSVLAAQAPLPTPTPAVELEKDYYTIALIGDSMVDTMGEDGSFLRDALARKYPNVQFIIYNYGKGARNVSMGLADFHEPFQYKDRNYESIDTVKPDVIIVGSFGYNVFAPHDRNEHWLEYTKLVQEARKITKNVYMLAEIAPVRSGFGLGPQGVMWDPSRAWTHTGHIIEQLENVIGLSGTLQIPVIDTFTPSLADGQKEGRRELINPSDNIHPSVQGHEFMAKIIAETIEIE